MADQLHSTREALIVQVREVASRLGKRSLSRSDFQRETGVSEWQISKNFDSWNDLVQSAGLEPYTQNVRLGEDDLLKAMRDAYVSAGGVVSIMRFRKVCRYSDDAYKKRWGGFRNAQLRFREWVVENDPEFPYLDQLPGSDRPQIPPTSADRVDAPVAWPSQQGDLYGEFINFRSLQHAPVNEQGVVLLFGMVAHDLGFVIERVQTGYPDCEAKRLVKGGRYERVRVEFEFRSSNFNHPPGGCDLVVCWEHTWPDCPVEVLELRSAIKALSNEAR
jgi:hypothetical protein